MGAPIAFPPTLDAIGARPAASEASVELAPWSRASLVGFRFAFAYLVCSTAANAVEIPLIVTVGFNKMFRMAGMTLGWPTRAADAIGRWVLHTKPTTFGSTGQFITQTVGTALLAAIVASVWSVADRRRANYTRLHLGLHTYLRYFLGVVMIFYGLAKIVPSQFPGVLLPNLITPLGQLDRMALMWSFMGASRSYEVFTGLAETVGALLLFSRRTSTLGALILVGILSNVVVMNFVFDVPIKISAAVYLFAAMFLVAPHVRALLDYFVRGRYSRLVEVGLEARAFPGGAAGVALKGALTVAMIFFSARYSYKGGQNFWPTQHNRWYGVYDVQSFVRNRDTVPPLLTDSTRWRRAVSGSPGRWSIQGMDDKVEGYKAVDDSVRQTLTLTPSTKTRRPLGGRYRYMSSGTVALDLATGDDSLHIILQRVALDSFPLFRLPTGW